MAEQPWWQTGVIYQIAVPSFADADGDGRGDLRGIIEHLDYLNDGTPDSLGVSAIWLTPIFDSPLRDFGYDVRDYRTVNPRLGSDADLDELIAACHERGIRVMLDLPLNHTSDEHLWFAESRASRESPRRDWYVWQSGRAPGRPPNRWRAVVEGSAWQWDAATEQYYYHAFLPFQPDLNWRNPEVREEMFGVVRYWLERGVDGFRLDLINFLHEDAQLRDNPPKPGVRPYAWQRHLHDRTQPESIEVVRELRDLLDSYDDRAMMGEVFADHPEECLACLGSGTDALHLAFYLHFATRRWSAGAFRRSVDWLEEHIPQAAWPCYYLNNHDLPRTYSRLSRLRPGRAHERARVAAAMLLTLRGTPIIYYGEELGMPEARVPRDRMDDPVGRRFWPLPVDRDGSRTPMPWKGEPGAGFTGGVPWLPVDPSYHAINVEAQSGRTDSLLNWYRVLIHLRAQHPALTAGTYRTLAGTPRGVFAYVRETTDERVAVLLNFRGRSVRLRSGAGLPAKLKARREQAPTEPYASEARTLLSTHRVADTPVDLTDLRLAPYEAIIVRLEG